MGERKIDYLVDNRMTDTRMKFKTRLWITFVTMIVLPIVLTAIAFGIISYTVIHKEGLNFIFFHAITQKVTE